jgi:CRP-like cAMP-binding protein
LADYAEQKSVRARLVRHLWYTARRNSLNISTDHFRNLSATPGEANHTGRVLTELGRSYLLGGLDEEQLKLLVPSTRIVEFGMGEVVIHDGERGNTFYVLLRGRVEVLERDNLGQLHVVRHTDERSEDNFFGEISLLTGKPRTTTIRALTDLEVLEVDRDGFTRLFKAKPEAASTIADVAAKRLEETRLRSAEALHPTTSTSHWLLATMRQLFDF